MAEDAFARKERKVPPPTRAAPTVSSLDERVTVVCGCGVVMTLSWRRAEPVLCFGCRRVFAPPPTATGAPLRWRPELISRRDELPIRAIALAGTIAAVLLLLLALALHVLWVRPV